MKNVVDQIVEEASSCDTFSSDRETIKFLAHSNHSIVLWGSGLYAEYVHKILTKNNIHLDAVFADEVSQNTWFHGKPVITFAEVQRQFDRFIVVRGNGNLMREAEYRRKEGVAAVCSIFDLMGFGWHLDLLALKRMALSINQLYCSLSDDRSRQSFFAYLKSRYLGNWCFIQNHFCPNMYFPDFFHLGSNEIFIDCGAYTGDTFRLFQERVSSWDTYLAFEPASQPFQKLKSTVSEAGLNGTVKLYNLGVWSRQTKLKFLEENDVSRFVNPEAGAHGATVAVTTIDDICRGMNVSYIKMDLEGSEMEALQGAKQTIYATRPKLAISIYHRESHLVEVFELLRQINSGYKFYFRIHTKVGSDAVLYAI